ncbi:MAG: hypothetical protein KF812_04925 [Fimbriimonadaceae bacterium]|nr:hypothetical protein [Fimbriimonadaceae bacterium]
MGTMVDVAEVWAEALPAIKDGVTGVGVWAALNSSVPIALEDDTLVIGLPSKESELSGHLRLAQTKRVIEHEVTIRLNQKVTLRVIEGTSEDDWATEKKRDAERKRLQDQALARAKREIEAGTSWETIYEQLSRRYAATPNRSLPQNRARFFMDAVAVVAEALQETPVTDDLSERQFARCIERISQYSEIPSTIVAMHVLQKSFEG